MHNSLGAHLMALNRDLEAIPAFRAAIQYRPQWWMPYKNLGIALREQGQLSEAITAFDQAIALNPNDAKMREYLQEARSQLL